MSRSAPDGAAAALRLLRFAATWALASSATTAFVGSAARALCLPPYWPAGFAFRCRPDGLLVALLAALADAAVTTLLLTVPALAVGAAIHLLVRGVRRLRSPEAGRVAGAVAGAGLWIALAVRLEPSYLDFILGGYAIAAGAAVAALIGAAAGGPRRGPHPPPPRRHS